MMKTHQKSSLRYEKFAAAFEARTLEADFGSSGVSSLKLKNL